MHLNLPEHTLSFSIFRFNKIHISWFATETYLFAPWRHRDNKSTVFTIHRLYRQNLMARIKCFVFTSVYSYHGGQENHPYQCQRQYDSFDRRTVPRVQERHRLARRYVPLRKLAVAPRVRGFIFYLPAEHPVGFHFTSLLACLLNQSDSSGVFGFFCWCLRRRQSPFPSLSSSFSSPILLLTYHIFLRFLGEMIIRWFPSQTLLSLY